LVVHLFNAAEHHAPTVAGILGVTQRAVSARMSRRSIRVRMLRARKERSANETRARWLRVWWRKRLRAIGVDPATLPTSDPLWSACHRFPRGHYVRLVAAEMRAEYPGESIATPERIEEILRRVSVLVVAATAIPPGAPRSPPRDAHAPKRAPTTRRRKKAKAP
jgi:hypothetical protein